MKNLNRKLSFGVALAMTSAILSCVPSVSASAAAVYGDANGDGKVTIGDAVCINKYLCGVYRVSDIRKLDVNKSLTVDYADTDYVLAEICGSDYLASYYSRYEKREYKFPSVVGYTANNDDMSMDSRAYIRYSYKDKKQLSDYVLKPATETISAGSSRTIVGDDTRYLSTSASENTGIVHLSSGATGFVVGDHEIATAAHCVYQNNVWFDIKEIKTYDENGAYTGKNLTPVEAHIPKKCLTDSDVRYDYALITVKENLSNLTHFSLATSYNLTASDFSDIPLYVSGFPQDLSTVEKTSPGNIYSGEGRVLVAKDSVLAYTNDTLGGDSGAPVYAIIKEIKSGKVAYNYSVMAIHHGGVESYNNGTIVTKYLLQFYKNNPYIEY